MLSNVVDFVVTTSLGTGDGLSLPININTDPVVVSSTTSIGLLGIVVERFIFGPVLSLTAGASVEVVVMTASLTNVSHSVDQTTSNGLPDIVE